MSYVSRTELTEYLDELFGIQDVRGDPSNNGLQVEGRAEVGKALFGVDACQELFEHAADIAADFIFVHHGVSWGSGFQYLSGITACRLRLLLQNDLSLYACHLPLDRHPEYGHNALIAAKLGVQEQTPFFEHSDVKIGICGNLSQETDLDSLSKTIESDLNTSCRIIGDKETNIQRVGIVSGGGADALEACVTQNLDCLITGEMDHKHYHISRETGIPMIVGGHYRTEVPGVEKTRELVQQKFGITCNFHDTPSGL